MKHTKLEFEIVDPESGDADLFAIKKTAQNIRERMGKINSAAHWIAIGADLSHLHKALANPKAGYRHGIRRITKDDNQRIGWGRAFELGHIPLSKAFATRIMCVYNFSEATGLSSDYLPCYINALYFLVTKFKDPKLIRKLVDDGRITPASNEGDLRTLAHELGLLAKKVKAPLDKDSPKGSRVNAVLKLMQKLGLRVNDLKQGDK
jgi:hypothetical protein